MASVKAKFTVGVFVSIGFVLSVVAIVWLGMSHYFEGGKTYVIYFDESVQGLGVDSPVKYRGVSIGRVEKISVAPDNNLIQVIIIVERSIDNIKQIAGKLKSVGITGIMFVELEITDPKEPDLSPKITFPAKYPIIASRPSEIKQFISSINDLLAQFKSIDIAGISKAVKNTIKKIDRALDNAQVEAVTNDLRKSMANFQAVTDPKRWDPIIKNIDRESELLLTTTKDAHTTIDNLNRIVVENEKNIQSSIADLRKSFEKIEIMSNEGSELIQQVDQSIEQFEKDARLIIQNLEKASGHIDRLTDALADQPSQMLLAEPPPGKKIEPENSD